MFPVTINLDTSRSHLDAPAVQDALETSLGRIDALRQTVNVTFKPSSDRIGCSLPYMPFVSRLTYPFADASPSTYTLRVTSSSTSQPTYQISKRDLLIQVNDKSSASTVADSVSAVLTKLLLPPADNAYKLRVAQYAPRYRLAFSLLNEDASVGGGALSWDVEPAIRREFEWPSLSRRSADETHPTQGYLSPTLRKLNVLHNFTIESQVQFHAPLAFEPHPIPGPDATPQEFVIGADNLKVFVNSAEWTLGKRLGRCLPTSSGLTSFLSQRPALQMTLFSTSFSLSRLEIGDRYTSRNQKVGLPSCLRQSR